MDPIAEFKQASQKTVEHLKEELQTIRTGRASANMIEGMLVDTYGGSTKMRLMEMASIMNEGATTLVITPYDHSTIQDIEKAILKSPLNLTPKVQGSTIRVVFPALNQEQREKFVKLVGQKVEEHRISIRGQRDDAKKKIKAQFDAKELTEDDKRRIEKDLDGENQKIMDVILELKEKKDAQIMEV